MPKPFFIALSSKYKGFWKAIVNQVPEEEPNDAYYDNSIERYLTLLPEDTIYEYNIDSYHSISPEIIYRYNFLSLKIDDEQVLKLTIEFEPEPGVRHCYAIKRDMKIDFKSHLCQVCPSKR